MQKIKIKTEIELEKKNKNMLLHNSQIVVSKSNQNKRIQRELPDKSI